MAKLIEEVLVIKISKIVKDSDKSVILVSDEAKASIEEALPTVLEELMNDSSLVIEIVET